MRDARWARRERAQPRGTGTAKRSAIVRTCTRGRCTSRLPSRRWRWPDRSGRTRQRSWPARCHEHAVRIADALRTAHVARERHGDLVLKLVGARRLVHRKDAPKRMRSLAVVGHHRGAQLAPVELGIAFGSTKVVVVQQHLVATGHCRTKTRQIRHAMLASVE